MFKGVSIALVRDLAGGIKKTEVATVSLGRRITRVFKKAVLSAKVFGTQLKVLAAQGFKKLGGGFNKKTFPYHITGANTRLYTGTHINVL